MQLSFNNLFKLGELSHAIEFDQLTHDRVSASHQSLNRIIEEKRSPIYGVHTGFGSNVTTAKDCSSFQETQFELLKYLHVGFGEHFDLAEVRRALRLQAMKVSQGFSGIHPETFNKLCRLSNAKELPHVPRWGSLGASGDLIPMAHAVAPLFSDPSQILGPRDVIGLVNTNSMMASFAIKCLSETYRQAEVALQISVINATALGYRYVAPRPLFQINKNLDWLESAFNRFEQFQLRHVAAHQQTTERAIPVQEKYSIRCAPQVFGNIFENLELAETKIVREALAVADNPIIDCESEKVIHGGLFYTAPLASAADLMTDGLSKIAELLDRQILILMDPVQSHGLPENLKLKSQDHLKGIHQLVSSLVQGIRTFSMPARSLSFSCEGNNQDVVPATMVALNNCEQVMKLFSEVNRCALFCALRALMISKNAPVPDMLQLSNFTGFQIDQAQMYLSDAEIKTEHLSYFNQTRPISDWV